MLFISRKAVLKFLKNRLEVNKTALDKMPLPKYEEREFILSFIQAFIEELPIYSQIKGRSIGIWKRDKRDGSHYCSKCKNKAAFIKDDIEYLSPYCPWCGTALEEVEVESDNERN